ncbi:phosphinothricin acetyltransferase [Streptomyces sp. WMMB 714]|uniref:GNAT family N-acetyltransferase n=1 Tax=Streptomyces sp. WMMB 714 TaxID=1286822 RepID=UPI0005F80D2C|nr:GNAT family N-acetyltransferase [Streptomyces sp. WMMB 714]SCK39497.1 phosphinothricin acetyltransferase [Streptomyces sp. WMMB 714]
MSESTDILVRAAAEEDLKALTDIYNHYVRESSATFDTEPFTPAERRDWLLSHPEDGPYRLMVALEQQIAGTGSFAGTAEPSDLDGSPAASRGLPGPSGTRSGARGSAFGQVLGFASSSPFRTRPAYSTSVEVSVYVAPEAAGRGIGTLLYEHLFAALEGQDLHRAYAGITVPNAASVRLHERFGFELVGTYSEAGRKFGRYHDVQRYEKALGR